PKPNSMNAVVAVHVGAGYHSPEKLTVYKRLCHLACRKAVAMLERPDCTALEAVSSAVVVLENDPATNAGYGSNLTMCGNVECDASVMDGKSLKFGAVGALPRVENPVLVAKALCEAQARGPLSLGRIPPCFLVGEGAFRWAQTHLQVGTGSQLVTEQARRCHTKHKKRMRLSENWLDAPCGLEGKDDDCSEHSGCLLDTVGAVCLDKSGNVAAAVSSGGIWMKHSGRVGQAGVYGCGCWAENSADGSAVAVSTSGGGEHLIKTMLARQCADTLLSAEDGATALHGCFRAGFLDSPFLQDVSEKLGGVLTLKADAESAVCDVLWAHTTRTLCYGYMQTGGTSPKFGCSRLQAGETVGKSVVVGGTPLRLCSPFERDCL
ncbi:asparaginase, putative, partial [Ixodes scapularis]